MKSEVKSEVVGFFFLHWFNRKRLSDLDFPWLTPKIDQSKHNIKASKQYQVVYGFQSCFQGKSFSCNVYFFTVKYTVSADLALSLSVVIKVAWVLFAMLRTKTITKYWACAQSVFWSFHKVYTIQVGSKKAL